jgi:predicted ester cyclase
MDPSGFKEFCQGWITAFSDARVEVRNQIANEDTVVTEFTGRGTHDGPLQSPNGSIPATRKKLDMHFIEVLKLENGKVTEARAYFDSATLLRQLGVLPESMPTR